MSMRGVMAGMALSGLCSVASAQFVKGNEAVSPASPGRPELPEVRGANGTVCALDEACTTSLWYMVETSGGLQECTEPYARPGACRPSSYGSKKLPRLWVVKSKGIWCLCQYPDLGRKCADMRARPPANMPFSPNQ